MSARRWWAVGAFGAVAVLVAGAAGWSQGAVALTLPRKAAPVSLPVPVSRPVRAGAPAPAAPSTPAAQAAPAAVAGLGLVSRTYDITPRTAVYDVADGYTARTAPGQRLVFTAPRGKVILSVGTRVRLTWSGYSSDLPDAMGTDIAAQAVVVRDLHPVRLDRWTFEVVNPYLDCERIANRLTAMDCAGWRVRVVVTAVVADGTP